nr:nucleotide-binding alpha-beta plait domain-containing protein [Tanacetum cinerariifolium]
NGRSYANVLYNPSLPVKTQKTSSPSLDLTDDCLSSRDVSLSLIGKVKTLSSTSEGFLNVQVRYLGDLWIMLDFTSDSAKTSFRDHVGINSWFSVLRDASLDFSPEVRLMWIDIEEDPFDLYPLLNKNVTIEKDLEDESLPNPPGFTPKVDNTVAQDDNDNVDNNLNHDNSCDDNTAAHDEPYKEETREVFYVLGIHGYFIKATIRVRTTLLLFVVHGYSLVIS